MRDLLSSNNTEDVDFVDKYAHLMADNELEKEKLELEKQRMKLEMKQHELELNKQKSELEMQKMKAQVR